MQLFRNYFKRLTKLYTGEWSAINFCDCSLNKNYQQKYCSKSWLNVHRLEVPRGCRVIFVICYFNDTCFFVALICHNADHAANACSSANRPLFIGSGNGTITSPNYPGDYYNNARCEWLIDSGSNSSTFVSLT